MNARLSGDGELPHVVVIGDVMLDRDVDGHSDRLAPDAPVPVVDVDGIVESPGGAGLTALLCARSGVRVSLVAAIADDAAGLGLAETLGREVALLPMPAQGTTRTKVRVRAGGQSLVRVDEGGPGAPASVPVGAVRALLADADVVVVSDYGAGVTHHPAVRELVAAVAEQRPVVWDPHPRGAPPVPGVTLATPNVAEARRAASEEATCDEERLACATRAPDQLASVLRPAWRARAVCVTAGPDGAYLAASDTEPLFVPAVTVAAGDSCGAGDRFVASVAVALAGGALVSEAVTGAVRDASRWVADGGADGFRRRRSRWPGADDVGVVTGAGSLDALLAGVDVPEDGRDRDGAGGGDGADGADGGGGGGGVPNGTYDEVPVPAPRRRRDERLRALAGKVSGDGPGDAPRDTDGDAPRDTDGDAPGGAHGVGGRGDDVDASAHRGAHRGADRADRADRADHADHAGHAGGDGRAHDREAGVDSRGALGAESAAGAAALRVPAERGPVLHGPDEVAALAERLRYGGRTLVATGGCFDIVHAGHVATLQAARRLGDALVVLLNSDASVRRLKGPGRPVVPASDRARVLEAFDCVDAVVVFDEDDPGAVLEVLRPDVWAKGGDYGVTPLPESEVVLRHGGRVLLLPYLGGRSTTSIISVAARAHLT